MRAPARPVHRAALASALLLIGCQRSPSPPDTAARPGTGSGPGTGAATDAKWRLLHAETFSETKLGAPAWQPDPVPDDGPFADGGEFFKLRNVSPPPGYRLTQPLGQDQWLTIESYTRNDKTAFDDLVRVVTDPADAENRALRLRSPAHTDGTVIRSSAALPRNYRVSLRVGFVDFGDGEPGGKNGYDAGNEKAEPWWKDPSDIPGQGNGFYWLAIYDQAPRPHNNVWAHHHRKAVIDTDNCFPPWMELWDGKKFVESARRPVMMFVLDGKSEKKSPWVGHNFYTWAAGAWQPSGAFRAVDSYRPNTWYRAVIERRDGTFTLEIAGNFVHGGETVYRGTIDAAAHCVWHYNRDAAELRRDCIDTEHYKELKSAPPRWPAGGAWPDFFGFGDPHINFYEGSVLFDDIRLEVPADAP